MVVKPEDRGVEELDHPDARDLLWPAPLDRGDERAPPFTWPTSRSGRWSGGGATTPAADRTAGSSPSAMPSSTTSMLSSRSVRNHGMTLANMCS